MDKLTFEKKYGLEALDKYELEKICHGAARLVEADEVQALFDHIERNLFIAFKVVQGDEQGKELWRQVKSVNALKEQLEHYANAREYYKERES